MPQGLALAKQRLAGREFHKAPAAQNRMPRLPMPAVRAPSVARPGRLELSLIVEASLEDRPQPPFLPGERLAASAIRLHVFMHCPRQDHFTLLIRDGS